MSEKIERKKNMMLSELEFREAARLKRGRSSASSCSGGGTSGLHIISHYRDNYSLLPVALEGLQVNQLCDGQAQLG